MENPTIRGYRVIVNVAAMPTTANIAATRVVHEVLWPAVDDAIAHETTVPVLAAGGSLSEAIDSALAAVAAHLRATV